MAPTSEKEPAKHARKLVKKNKSKKPDNFQYPPHLQEGEDVDEDVTAPREDAKVQQVNLNQSMLSLITAAGSKKDFHARFDDESSGSETEGDESGSLEPELTAKPSADPNSTTTETSSDAKKRHNRTQSALRRSLPKLNIRTKKEKNYMSHSLMFLPKRVSLPTVDSQRAITPREAPVLSRMLEAQARSTQPSADQEDDAIALVEEPDQLADPDDASLKARLQDIFGFETGEEVLSEYPAWLLQSVLLQGYLYVTEKHLAFYAYLPKKSSVVAKSGYLSKKGKQSPKYSRYWFSLKGDVFSYYSDPSHLYFPSGNIDLRYGISASLQENSKEKSKETGFNVSTHTRTYFFRADSTSSAREWVKTLQKVIFRSHNDGDSVKISIPIANIIDLEESPVVDFADTIKIRVIDSDETYAIDEYFFSFFSFGKDAVEVLRSLIENSSPKNASLSLLHPHSASASVPMESSVRHIPALQDHVRATLSPIRSPISTGTSPRGSGEWSRGNLDTSHRRSMDIRSARNSGDWTRKSIDIGRDAMLPYRRSFDDRGRRSASTSRVRMNEKHAPERSPSVKHTESSDSFVQPSTSSSAFNDSSNASASQILSRSDVFQSPTIKRHAEASASDKPPNRDTETVTTGSPGRVHVHPPSRHQSQMSPQLSPRDTTGTFQSIEQREDSSTSLQDLVKGSFPLQKAAGFAGYLRRGSKRMSDLLASESMGYVEKVSGMWAGGRKHYADTPEPEGADPEEGLIEDEATKGHGDRFRAHFALPPTEKLQATYFGYLHRVLPLYGKIYIGERHFCFRSLLPGTKTRLILPLGHIENVTKERGFSGIRYAGLVIVIQAYEELFFEFSQTDVRDDCAITLLQSLDTIRYLRESGMLAKEDPDDAEIAKEEHKMLQEARRLEQPEHDLKLPQSAETVGEPGDAPTILFDDPRSSIINFKPTESLRITCLTIGSRGDVQPYIALCKGLMAEGHKVRIATHREFEPWIRKYGIDFAPVEGDPAELMRICVENGMFTVSFLKEASVKFRGWIDELLSSAWTACQDSDLLIESPSAMAGIHIAEALGIPYFRAFGMPWTRTRAYPHAFAVPERKMGGAYNYVTYVMFDNVFWTAIAGQVNRWRKKELGLRSTNLDKLHPNKVPFLYNFSPSVVIPPLDFSDWIRVTGFWFLDEAGDWTPPKELQEFIDSARRDEKKLVYIGFGSIVVSDPAALTRTVVESVVKADVRCILSKGWSDRLGNKDTAAPEVPLPDSILQIKAAPHDWLFKQIDAAAHHGGAGTTGASLRAGLPTIIKPFFGDQFFFGTRVEDLGVGISMKKLNTSVFSRALWEATHSERMIAKAKVLGEQIRKEDGVGTAIQALYRDMEYAKTLIKGKNAKGEAEPEGGDEESWTFIGDESDPELIRRISEWHMPTSGRAVSQPDLSGGNSKTPATASTVAAAADLDGVHPPHAATDSILAQDQQAHRRQRSAFSSRMLGKAAWPKVPKAQ